jgi:hypothetical protein
MSLTKIYGANVNVPTGTGWTTVVTVAPVRVLTAVFAINDLVVGTTVEARWIGTVEGGDDVVLWTGSTTIATGGAGLVTAPVPIPSVAGRLEIRHSVGSAQSIFAEVFKV